MPMDLRIVLVLATMGSLVVSDERWVKVMSMKMVDAVEKYAALDLPNLPALASQLGLHALVNSVVKAGLADALSSPGKNVIFNNIFFSNLTYFVLSNPHRMGKEGGRIASKYIDI